MTHNNSTDHAYYFKLIVVDGNTEKKNFQIYLILATAAKHSDKESSLSSYRGSCSYSNDVLIMYHKRFDNNNNESRIRSELLFDTGSRMLQR